MRLSSLRFAPIVLLLVLLLVSGSMVHAAGSSRATSTSQAHAATVASGSTHYLYVDDGACPDTIDAYQIGSSLTPVGSYSAPGCIFPPFTGPSTLAVAAANSTHGPCLIYSGIDSNKNGFVASYPINSDGSLGTMVSQVATQQGDPYGGVQVDGKGKFAFTSESGVDIETFAIGSGCSLTFAHAFSTGNATDIDLTVIAHNLVTPDATTSGINSYQINPDGSLSFLNVQYTNSYPGLAVQTYHTSTGTQYRVFASSSNAQSQVQAEGGVYAVKTGVITPLHGSPRTDTKATNVYAIFFDNTDSLLIQSVGVPKMKNGFPYYIGKLAIYRVQGYTMSFVSNVSMASSTDAPAFFAQSGSTLFLNGVDSQSNHDVETCTLSSSGVSGCVDAATVTNSSGGIAGMVIH